MHDVAQVVVTPLSHLMQAATYCLISFGLYDGKRLAAHLFVASPSVEQETKRKVGYLIDFVEHAAFQISS